MKNIFLTSVLLSFLALSNCSNKKNQVKNISNQDCDFFYKKFKENLMIEQNDSAIIYIEKAIDCNSEKKSYKSDKLRFLISIGKYEKAVNYLSELNSKNQDISYSLLKSILLLKIKDKNAEISLEEVYTRYKKIKNPNSTDLFYRIALDNFFKGKEYSLIELDKIKKNTELSEYEIQNFTALHNLINEKDKNSVLFSLFSIEE